jgi:hypothetical protein
MCYEYWYPQKLHSGTSRDERIRPRRELAVEEDEALMRAQEVIEKAMTAKSTSWMNEPVISEKEKEAETIPA